MRDLKEILNRSINIRNSYIIGMILLMLLIELHVREYKKGRRALLATEIKSIENRAEISGLEKVYDKLSY